MPGSGLGSRPRLPRRKSDRARAARRRRGRSPRRRAASTHVGESLGPRPRAPRRTRGQGRRSFVAGVALGAPLDPTVQLIIVSGFCGDLTTFSTFAVETVQLMLEGKRRAAAASLAHNLAFGVVASVMGIIPIGMLLDRVLDFA